MAGAGVAGMQRYVRPRNLFMQGDLLILFYVQWDTILGLLPGELCVVIYTEKRSLGIVCDEMEEFANVLDHLVLFL